MEKFEQDIRKAHEDRINSIFSNFKESDDLIKGGPGSGRHALYMQGGSIGDQRKHHPKHGKLISVHEDIEEAKEKAKQYNSRLSPGEKSYYKMKYHVKPYDEKFHKEE